ncbi:MAG: hypothetical protein FWD47_14005 [Treponema sp.]|nr:hypothetical protein [Treponema sp.]
MKNKMFSLVGILALMLVFGMTVVGCVSAELERQPTASQVEREQRETRRIAEGRGGKIEVHYNIQTTPEAYYCIHPKYSFRASREPWLRGGGSNLLGRGTIVYIAEQDGDYVFAYLRRGGDRTNINHWIERTYYMSGNNTVTINIPGPIFN